jgi:ribosomal protein S18 acetylase RimI-like enzyme
MPTSPPSRAELAAIEDAGLQASAAPGQRMLDGWLLRFSPGKAKRARCVNALADGRLAVGDKLVLCEQAYAEVVGSLRGSSLAQRDAHAQRLALASGMWRSLVLRQPDGDAHACGQVAVTGDLAGLYDVFTAPMARGRRLARALCIRLLSLACADGARRAYLQVESDNAPARAIYHSLGFADAYAYHYRTRDPLAA